MSSHRENYHKERYARKIEPPTQKQCTACHDIMTSASFYKHPGYKDGLRSECKKCHKLKVVGYLKKNPHVAKKASKKWNKSHKQIHKKAYSAIYQKHKRDTDINYKLSDNLRRRLRQALRGNTKRGSVIQYTGCAISELKLYIESLFQPDMSWSNWSLKGWHIDHIIPLCSFDLTDPEQLKLACHYTNLQPLWARDNLAKRALDIRSSIHKKDRKPDTIP